MSARTLIPGAIYGDFLPSGAFVALIPNSHIQTNLGRVDFPLGEAFGPCFPRCAEGPFRFAGQAHDTLDPACWEWIEGAGWHALPPPCCGVSPVIYDLDGVLHRSDCGSGVGSQGYRYVNAANQVISGDATYGPFHGLFEYTYLGDDLWVGQAAYDGGGVQVLERGVDGDGRETWILHQLELGNCRFIRGNRVDGTEPVALAFTRPEGVVLLSTTMAELRALPPVDAPEPPGPDPRPIGPTGPSRPADGHVYDLLTYVLGDAVFWPRQGPDHTLGQIVRGQLYYYVKFAGNEPGAAHGESYEAWAFDANWLYILEDASAGDTYSFTDPRMWPRHQAIGEAHAFNTGHDAVWRDRATCRETRREVFGRHMWIAAIQDWYWGPDLGTRETAILVYDDTGGFHIPGRYIELGYYALGAGSVRWEAHASERVYASGMPVFTDATRAEQKSFYLRGGPNPDPKILACTPQTVPSYPPPDPPDPQPEPPEPDMTLPAHCFVLMHNGNIATVTPGQTAVELNHQPQEYGGFQGVEVAKSSAWTKEDPRVLVRFVDANRLFRVDKVLALQQKYDQCLQTWDPAAADADSVWQQGIASGPYVHFTSDSADGQRHGIVYTLTCVDSSGALFK